MFRKYIFSIKYIFDMYHHLDGGIQESVFVCRWWCRHISFIFSHLTLMVSVQYQSSLPIKPSFPPAHLSCSLHRQETDVPHFLCLSTDNLSRHNNTKQDHWKTYLDTRTTAAERMKSRQARDEQTSIINNKSPVHMIYAAGLHWPPDHFSGVKDV